VVGRASARAFAMCGGPGIPETPTASCRAADLQQHDCVMLNAGTTKPTGIGQRQKKRYWHPPPGCLGRIAVDFNCRQPFVYRGHGIGLLPRHTVMKHSPTVRLVACYPTGRPPRSRFRCLPESEIPRPSR